MVKHQYLLSLYSYRATNQLLENKFLVMVSVRKTSDYDHIKLDLNYYNYFYSVHYLEYCMCIIWNMRTHDFCPDNNNANDCSLKLGLSFVTVRIYIYILRFCEQNWNPKYW